MTVTADNAHDALFRQKKLLLAQHPQRIVETQALRLCPVVPATAQCCVTTPFCMANVLIRLAKSLSLPKARANHTMRGVILNVFTKNSRVSFDTSIKRLISIIPLF